MCIANAHSVWEVKYMAQTVKHYSMLYVTHKFQYMMSAPYSIFNLSALDSAYV